jgi:hypothetical protein
MLLIEIAIMLKRLLVMCMNFWCLPRDTETKPYKDNGNTTTPELKDKTLLLHVFPKVR